MKPSTGEIRALSLRLANEVDLRETARHRRHELARTYRLSIERYDALLEAQDFRCAVCEESFIETPQVDHDHSCCDDSQACGECIRGLLCRRCNVILGQAHDDRRFLSQMFWSYLDAWELEHA